MSQLSPATLAWLADLNATIRADERAQVSEEIAQAITAQRRTGITAMLEGGWNHCVETMAGIAREHGTQPAETAVERPESIDACRAKTDDPKAAQTLSGGEA